MIQAVGQKKCKLPQHAVPILPCLGVYTFYIDNDIPQNQFSALRIKAVSRFLFRPGKITGFFKMQIGKGKHIRFGIRFSEIFIVFPDSCAVRNQQVYRGFIRAALSVENRRHHTVKKFLLIKGKGLRTFIFNVGSHNIVSPVRISSSSCTAVPEKARCSRALPSQTFS